MIKVMRPGLFTTIQDKGRFGYRNIGVPISGAMDSISANFANALLNNNENNAVMEITMLGPKLEFTEPTLIVISGAEISPMLNNISISNNKVLSIKKGDIVSFGELTKGLHAYLAVKGGFKTAEALNSKSFYTGITTKGFLQKNDTVPYIKEANSEIIPNLGINTKKQFFETNILEVYKGPEFDFFTIDEQNKLLSYMYTVSNQMNRMGYRLEEIVVLHNKSIITSPILPGTVQLTPSGQLIVLMKDAQTTGGYPRVFQLTEKSIAILAQKKSGDKFNFVLV